MSFKSWCKEFYPVPADKVGKADALEHSIRKWQGLLPGALKRHGLRLQNGGLYRGDELELCIGANSCALCIYYPQFYCLGCPLVKVRNATCDNICSDEVISPYHSMYHDNDPKPMLRWLRRARKVK